MGVYSLAELRRTENVCMVWWRALYVTKRSTFRMAIKTVITNFVLSTDSLVLQPSRLM